MSAPLTSRISPDESIASEPRTPSMTMPVDPILMARLPAERFGRFIVATDKSSASLYSQGERKMRYELSVEKSYVGDWGADEGIREFMQNGRDAEIEQNAKLNVSHRVDTAGRGVLVIENEGAVLAKDTLLLGRSTKRDREDLAGQYGEGYKLGALALVRAGYAVRIRNGGEVWTATIERSDKFDSDVLVFHVVGGRQERNRVQVEIVG